MDLTVIPTFRWNPRCQMCYTCKNRTEPKLEVTPETLAKQSWESIMASGTARQSITKVAACEQNCCMVTTARTAMRSTLIPQAPKTGSLLWVLRNKLKATLGQRIDFDSYIDNHDIKPTPHVPRLSNLENHSKVKLVRNRGTADKHYPLKVLENT